MVAGISLISQAAASFTDIAGYTAAAAAAAVGFLGLFNGAGRIFWAAMSERLGRMQTFIAILALEGVCLLLIPHVSNAVLFFILAAVVYLCYGGAFGTMPATAGDFFGVKNAGGIYGLMLIGWSLGGVVGPLIAAALIGAEKNYSAAYTTIGIIALVAIVLPVVTRMPRVRQDADRGRTRRHRLFGPDPGRPVSARRVPSLRPAPPRRSPGRRGSHPPPAAPRWSGRRPAAAARPR